MPCGAGAGCATGCGAGCATGWATGWTGALGWVFPLTPAFALDAGLELHRFEVEYRHDPYVDRWTNRWIGLRLLAVMTFGGER